MVRYVTGKRGHFVSDLHHRFTSPPLLPNPSRVSHDWRNGTPHGAGHSAIHREGSLISSVETQSPFGGFQIGRPSKYPARDRVWPDTPSCCGSTQGVSHVGLALLNRTHEQQAVVARNSGHSHSQRAHLRAVPLASFASSSSLLLSSSLARPVARRAQFSRPPLTVRVVSLPVARAVAPLAMSSCH